MVASTMENLHKTVYPELPIRNVLPELWPGQFVGFRVPSVTVNSIENNLKLSLREALKLITCQHGIWKSND